MLLQLSVFAFVLPLLFVTSSRLLEAPRAFLEVPRGFLAHSLAGKNRSGKTGRPSKEKQIIQLFHLTHSGRQTRNRIRVHLSAFAALAILRAAVGALQRAGLAMTAFLEFHIARTYCEVAEATAATMADYEAVAEGYAAGNMNHDVSQNINAMLAPIKRKPPCDLQDSMHVECRIFWALK